MEVYIKKQNVLNRLYIAIIINILCSVILYKSAFSDEVIIMENEVGGYGKSYLRDIIQVDDMIGISCRVLLYNNSCDVRSVSMYALSLIDYMLGNWDSLCVKCYTSSEIIIEPWQTLVIEDLIFITSSNVKMKYNREMPKIVIISNVVV